ncbi:Fe-S cluster assembly sulfur transfer protein SufU [Mycetocola reblochoni]|uniref:SUF system NifU family Fe-S cluster assembly protein n=2 Tax=Mycetocola reblochoni TaxID=331618 RepID=A0A3L6ZTP4_9MICO|nr:SUF system NifU family Fe-S cluster assembly protein [Mycetocola reblochoni]RLP71025.1 SUF system NifU family Fe-S cluster assembly protein [Mycetocola reblochoni]
MANALDSLYQQVILDHSKQRHGSGLRDGFLAEDHQLNPTCGDEITVRLHGDDALITGISWEGQGCSISMASASILSDLVAEGLSREQLAERIELFRALMHSRGKGIEQDDEPLGDAVVLEGVSKFSARVKCGMLAWVATEHAMTKEHGA